MNNKKAVKSEDSFSDSKTLGIAVKNRVTIRGAGVKTLKPGFNYFTSIVGGLDMELDEYRTRLRALIKKMPVLPLVVFIENEALNDVNTSVSHLVELYKIALEELTPYAIKVGTSGTIMPVTNSIYFQATKDKVFKARNRCSNVQAKIDLALTEIDLIKSEGIADKLLYGIHRQLLDPSYLGDCTLVVSHFAGQGLKVCLGELATRINSKEAAIAVGKGLKLTEYSYCYLQAGYSKNAVPISSDNLKALAAELK